MSLSNDRRGSYTVLWSAFLLCLFPFLLLSFFNIMSTDDLILLKSLQDRGLFPTQGYMFGWTGRYTAIFIESLLMEAGASRWYFVHTWLLLAVNWGAFYYVLVTVNTRLLIGRYSRRVLLLGAAVLLLLFFLYPGRNRYQSVLVQRRHPLSVGFCPILIPCGLPYPQVPAFCHRSSRSFRPRCVRSFPLPPVRSCDSLVDTSYCRL